jgi:hypothetical protein
MHVLRLLALPVLLATLASGAAAPTDKAVSKPGPDAEPPACAEGWSRPASRSPFPVPTCPAAPAASHADEALVNELVAILNETASRDTFCMTVQILGALKADPRLVAPAIIRNAERLKISKGILKPESQWTPEQEIVARGLQFFISGKETPGVTDRWQGPAPYETQWQRSFSPVPTVGTVSVPAPAKEASEPGPASFQQPSAPLPTPPCCPVRD